MISRVTVFILSIAAALALAACGSGGDSSGEQDSSAVTEAGSATTADTTGEATTEIPPAEDSAVTDAGGGDDGCDQVVTVDEIDAIFGSSVMEIKGSSEQCSIIFASDAVGGIGAFSGSKADEAIEALLAQFEANNVADSGGVLLADGRGYVTVDSVVVVGDSGRVFSIAIPGGFADDDRLGAMQAFADLLLGR